MAQKEILVELAIPERVVFSGPVESIVAPGIQGSIGVLPGHMPLVVELGIGRLLFRRQGEEKEYALGGGIMEVKPHRVRILANTAEAPGEIDIERAETAYRRAREQLQQPERYDIAKVRATMHRAATRLKVAHQVIPDPHRRTRKERERKPEE